jgi:hypothetical protein
MEMGILRGRENEKAKDFGKFGVGNEFCNNLKTTGHEKASLLNHTFADSVFCHSATARTRLSLQLSS